MQNTDRILSTHVGSLPRPDDLKALLYAREEGQPVDMTEFDALADAAVDDAVHRQVEAGIDIVSDGELAKPGFVSYILQRLSGFERFHELWSVRDLEDLPELYERQYGGAAMKHIDRGRCIAPIEYVGQDELDKELRRLKQAAERWGATDAFVPAVPPAVISRTFPNEHYGSDEAYQDAVVAALRVEYEAIVDAGLILQLDCTDIPSLPSMSGMEWTQAEAMIDNAVDALNQATQGLPADRLRMHLCWGNWEGPHRYDVALRTLLPHVWRARPQAISFEAANPRHAHEWQVFRDIKPPEDKVLMPGVIDTKNNVVEHPELVAERIERFAGLVGRENVIPGTDCGFGTFAGFGAVFPKVAWMKLDALGQGATLASGRLWS